MLIYLAGLGALIVLLLALNGFKRANIAMLAQRLRTIGGITALSLAAVCAVRGLIGYALPLAMLGAWLVSGAKMSWPGLPGQGTPNEPKTSRVVTDHLEMELDHASGSMRGKVLKGVFAGRSIERLAPAELALLWRDCRFVDPKSAQLVEAFLDRSHPTWREDMARAENEPGAGGIMTRTEAYEILGLKPGASEDDIRKAHRELMKKLHPDRGGSDYLASKINEAKDLLSGKG